MKPNNFARMGIICTQKTHLHCSALTKSPAGRDTIHFMEKRTPALNYVIRQDTASTLSSAWTLSFLSKKGVANDFVLRLCVANDTIHVVEKRTSRRCRCKGGGLHPGGCGEADICTHPSATR